MSETENEKVADSNTSSNQSQSTSYYQRKKNWIGGWDNDYINLILGFLGITTSAFTVAYMFHKPTRDFVDNIRGNMGLGYNPNMMYNQNQNPNYQRYSGLPLSAQPYQQQQLPQNQYPNSNQIQEQYPAANEQPYYEEEVTTPANSSANIYVDKRKPVPHTEPVEEEEEEEEEEEDDDEGMFYDSELKHRRKVLAGGKRPMKHYESPFGAKVSNGQL